MGASVISPIPNPYSIKSKPLLPDKDKKLKLRNRSQSSLTIISIKACEQTGYILNVINVIRILSGHYSQKVFLRGLSLNLFIKGFWNKCKSCELHSASIQDTTGILKTLQVYWAVPRTHLFTIIVPRITFCQYLDTTGILSTSTPANIHIRFTT